MPELTRPDGVQIHYEDRGEGPPVLLALSFFTLPEIYEELIGQLARDHRVRSYDPRGAGSSTREGPFDIETDAGDLEAVVEDLAADAERRVTLISIASANNVAVRVGARRPDIVGTLVIPGGAPLALSALEGSEGFAASESVADMMLEFTRTDRRGATRAMLASLNPQMGEDELRERVATTLEYISGDAGLGRAQAWRDDDPSEAVVAIGARMLSLRVQDNPWLPPDAFARAEELYPEARFEDVAVSMLERPEVLIDVVRREAAAAEAP